MHNDIRASQVAQRVKDLPAMLETQKSRVQSLGGEDPLEEGMATLSSILLWRVPWTKEPGGLQFTGPQRIRRDWRDWACTHNDMYPPLQIHTEWFHCVKVLCALLFISPFPQSLETNHLSLYAESVCSLTISLCAKLLPLCLTLDDLMDCSPPGSSVHGIFQARTLEWVAVPSCRGSSPPRDLLIATIYGLYPISLLYITWFSANQSRLPEILLKMQVIMSLYSLTSSTGYSDF